MKFLSKKRVASIAGGLLLLLAIAAGVVLLFLQLRTLEPVARRYIEDEIQKRTGGPATLDRVEWSLTRRRIRISGLTVWSSKGASAPPLARIPQIEIGVNLRSLLEKRIDLYELRIEEPEFYFEAARTGEAEPPAGGAQGTQNLQRIEVSIQNFRIVDGAATVNERPIHIDFSLTNLAAEMSFQSRTGVLSGHARFDGVFSREGATSIPYTFDGDMDYTKGSLLAHRIALQSGESTVKLQGRIDALLERSIHGRMEYSGSVRLGFLNYFFPKEAFDGGVDAAGSFDFSDGHFSTKGHETSKAARYDGWTAENLRSDYSYQYPEGRASFENLRGNAVGGAVAGKVAIENAPGKGPTKTSLDLNYEGLDSAALSRAYPWSPKYRVFSRLSGSVRGSFDGAFDAYSLSGRAELKAYSPPADFKDVPLPIDGLIHYEFIPGTVAFEDSTARLGSTTVKAAGTIRSTDSDLNFELDSTDLTDARFVTADANGSGTFSGKLTGPIGAPRLSGDFTLNNYNYRNHWKAATSAGRLDFDTAPNAYRFGAVHVRNGRSEIVINGNLGPITDLTIQAVRLYGEDLAPFVTRTIGGTLTGTARLTAFDPIRVEGDLRADGFRVDKYSLGNIRTHIRYFDPVVELTSFSLSQNNSSLTGDLTYNRTSRGIKFSARAASVDVKELYVLGLPESVAGMIREANVQGDGTLDRPELRGDAAIQNLAFQGETFAQVHVTVSSAASVANAAIEVNRNLHMTAQVNLASPDYGFTARANFTDYAMERLVHMTEGALTATGSVTIAGSLKDRRTVHGQAAIDSAAAVVRGYAIRTSQSFTLDFNTNQLTLVKMSVAGKGADATFSGTIGLGSPMTLGLDVVGHVDLGSLAAARPDLNIGGGVNVQGRIRGTPEAPDFGGVAHIANAALGKKDFFASVSALNGDLFFDGNRITLSNLEGRTGEGDLRLRGTALIQRDRIQGLNVQIETKGVRLRYPQGLRTVLDSTMVLRGSWGPLVEGDVQIGNGRAVVNERVTDQSLLLEGNVQIQSMSYRNDFEQFLESFQGAEGIEETESPFSRMRLAIHVAGGRNITIENQMANVQARVDLDVKGTVAKPALTGHVEASGGTLTFQGHRYQITRGNVDFVNPIGIEPAVDVQAETQIRDYRVILVVTGKGGKLHLNMSSDPPLSQFEIVNLIAGGKTREELEASSQPVPNEEKLFQGGAASILSDLLQQRVGSRFPLLGEGTQVRVDPSLLGSETGFSPRITVVQRISNGISLTYSQDISSNRQQIIQIEYFVSRNTSIVASRDELGDLGLDIRLRRRFK